MANNALSAERKKPRPLKSGVVAGRFAPGYNATDHTLVVLCEAPHNKRMQQSIPPANNFASGLAPDPGRWA